MEGSDSVPVISDERRQPVVWQKLLRIKRPDHSLDTRKPILKDQTIASDLASDQFFPCDRREEASCDRSAKAVSIPNDLGLLAILFVELAILSSDVLNDIAIVG